MSPWELLEHQEWIDPLLAAQWAERKAEDDLQPGR